jgi:hypothetical protein
VARSFGVDVEVLRAGAEKLKAARLGSRGSAAESAGFGSSRAEAAVGRYESYWVRGQSAVDDLTVGLAGALVQAADGYQRRDAEDAGRFGAEQGCFVGF